MCENIFFAFSRTGFWSGHEIQACRFRKNHTSFSQEDLQKGNIAKEFIDFPEIIENKSGLDFWKYCSLRLDTLQMGISKIIPTRPVEI